MKSKLLLTCRLNRMRQSVLLVLGLFFMTFAGQKLWAAEIDPPAYIIVDSISIEGNRKTLDNVILRELPFRQGDTISLDKLAETLQWAKEQVQNTGMFREADIIYQNWEGESNRVHLQVQVKESWYLYPIPYMELADRNFNVWWVDHNGSLERLIYGLDFTHRNFTGNRDRFQLKFNLGYTRRFAFSYELPFFDRQKIFGLSFKTEMASNRELNYLTKSDKQEFYKDEESFVYRRFRTTLGLSCRPGLRITHRLWFSYQHNQIADIVAQELNPDFFLDGRSQQRYLSLSYNYSYDTRDQRPYPLKGELITFNAEKDGLGLVSKDRNALTFQAKVAKFWPIGERWNVAAALRGKYSAIRTQQPYNDNRAMGFGDNTMKGYEYYIIDGLDMGMVSTSMRFKVLQKRINFGKLIPVERWRELPFRIYLGLNGDAGYVNNPFDRNWNTFSNRMLWGGGLSLDAVFFFDKVFKFEYSFNHLGEGGLFLHFNMNI